MRCTATEGASIAADMMEIDQPVDAGNGLSRIDRGAGTLTADASRLYRVYKTISSMLDKRGYMVSREMRDLTPLDFTQRFGEFPSREGLTILVVSGTIWESPDSSNHPSSNPFAGKGGR